MTVSGRWKYMTGKWRTMAILFGMLLECCARSMRHDATCHACHGLDTLNTPSRPRHSGVASIPLAASTETRGVQDCMSGTSIDYVNSTDIARLWARSSSTPLIFLQDTRCSTHAYHSHQGRTCGTVYRLLLDRSPATDSLGKIWKRIYSVPRNRSALWLDYCALYIGWSDVIESMVTIRSPFWG